MVKYEQYIYSTIHDALRKSYDNGGGWDGPDELHHGISATNPPPSWHLSPEGLEYHAECDRDLLDTIIHVAFMFGFHQGALDQQPHVDQLERFNEMNHTIIDSLREELRQYRPDPERSPELANRLSEIWADAPAKRKGN